MTEPVVHWEEVSTESKTLAERVLREDGPQPDPTTLPPAEGRAFTFQSNRRWNVNLPPMATDDERWIEADAMLGSAPTRVRSFVPNDVEGQGAILFVHGGGFAFCSPETHERCARVLAAEARIPVYMPDYRLAPEQPFPAGLKDVVATLRALRAGELSKAKPAFVILAGDSAGANLALAAVLHEQAESQPPLQGALLFYGCYAPNFETESYKRYADGPGLTRGKMQRYWGWYAGSVAISENPLAAPLAAGDAALKALPPLHLTVASVDPLASDTLILSQRLRGLGRDDELLVVPGVMHGFVQNTIDLEAARQTMVAAGEAARRMAAESRKPAEENDNEAA